MPRPGLEQSAAPPRSEGGIALIFTVAVILITFSIIFEFGYAATIGQQVSLNARDALQAEYNALAALRLRQVLIRESQAMSAAISAFTGGSGGANVSSQLAEMIPVECSLLNLVFTMAEEDVDAEDAGEGDYESFFPGECSATARSEHTKMSLNILGAGNAAARDAQNMLIALLSDPRLEEHFQEPDKNGVWAESPQELVGAIVDWVDADDDQAVNSSGDEMRPYDDLEVPYRPKNAPFDSVEELHMVHGIDDELYAILAPQFSAHTASAKILISKADYATILQFGLMACLAEGVTREMFLLDPEVDAFAYALKTMIGMGDMNIAKLQQLVSTMGMDRYFDTRAFNRVFTNSASENLFTVEASGMVDTVGRKIRAVYERGTDRLRYIRFEY